MEITELNRQKVKLFMKILMKSGVSGVTTEAIVAAIQTEVQMYQVVDYIEANPNATEWEIVDKVRNITH